MTKKNTLAFIILILTAPPLLVQAATVVDYAVRWTYDTPAQLPSSMNAVTTSAGSGYEKLGIPAGLYVVTWTPLAPVASYPGSGTDAANYVSGCLVPPGSSSPGSCPTTAHPVTIAAGTALDSRYGYYLGPGSPRPSRGSYTGLVGTLTLVSQDGPDEYQINFTVTANVTIDPPSCKVQLPYSAQVDLGDVNPSTSAHRVPFLLPLYCDQNTPPVTLSFDSASAPGGGGSTIPPTGASTGEGYVLSLTMNGQGVVLGAGLPVPNAPGLHDIAMEAVMERTGVVKAGTVSFNATYTLSYN